MSHCGLLRPLPEGYEHRELDADSPSVREYTAACSAFSNLPTDTDAANVRNAIYAIGEASKSLAVAHSELIDPGARHPPEFWPRGLPPLGRDPAGRSLSKFSRSYDSVVHQPEVHRRPFLLFQRSTKSRTADMLLPAESQLPCRVSWSTGLSVNMGGITPEYSVKLSSTAPVEDGRHGRYFRSVMDALLARIKGRLPAEELPIHAEPEVKSESIPAVPRGSESIVHRLRTIDTEMASVIDDAVAETVRDLKAGKIDLKPEVRVRHTHPAGVHQR